MNSEQLSGMWQCDECGERLPDRVEWTDEEPRLTHGTCTNPDCEESEW